MSYQNQKNYKKNSQLLKRINGSSLFEFEPSNASQTVDRKNIYLKCVLKGFNLKGRNLISNKWNLNEYIQKTLFDFKGVYFSI